MKRIALYLSVIVAVALGVTSCIDAVFPKGTEPTAVKPGPEVDITVTDVTDNSFKVSVAPQGDALYYSYLVAKGKAQEIDSVSLYQGKYSSLAQGVVKYADAASTSFEVEANPNTIYTVYAVAGGAEGVPGKVCTKTIGTSDTEAPVLKSSACEGNQISLTFSEDIEYVKGSEIYGGIYYKCYLTGNPYKAKTVASNVEVEGKVATITFDEVVNPGAFYTVNFAEGTFKDLAGNPCAALISKFTSDYDFSSDKFGIDGVAGYLENAPLGYELPEVPEFIWISDYASTSFTVKVKEGVAKIDCVDGYVTTLIRTTAAGAKVTEVVPMKKVINYGGTYYDFFVKPAGEPQDGDQMSITIPKGAVMDWWGNVNASDIVLGPVDVMAPLTADVTFTEIEKNYVTFDVTVSDKTGKKYWIIDFTPKADAMPDEDLVKAYVDEIADWAVKDGMSFEEEMATYYAYQGSFENLTQKKLVPDTEYQVAVFFLSSTGELISDVFRFDFKTLVDAETWTSLGMGSYTEDVVVPLFGSPTITYSVEIQESDLEAGRYRLVNPYGEAFPYNEPGDYDSDNHYMIINAQNPQLVYIEEFASGCNWGYGEFVIVSEATLYLNAGYSPDVIIGALGDIFGKLDNGVITFPKECIRLTFGANGPFKCNSSGEFKIVLPSAGTTSAATTSHVSIAKRGALQTAATCKVKRIPRNIK